MKLNVAKCKPLHLVWSNAKKTTDWTMREVESSPEEKDLGCW